MTNLDFLCTRGSRVVFMATLLGMLLTVGCGPLTEETKPDTDAGGSPSNVAESGVDWDPGLSINVHGTYGPYVVEAITLTGAPDGHYTFASPTFDSVALLRDGVPVKALSYDGQTTVSATDPDKFYTFDFQGYFTITLRKAGSGTRNLHSMRQSIFDGAHFLAVAAGAIGSSRPTFIEEHGSYRPYVIEAIVLTGAPSGAYTFVVSSPIAGSVELRRDGVPVKTVRYIWTTTVSDTNLATYYTFDFVGYFQITIRAKTGTVNLYLLNESIFDGTHVLVVPTPDSGDGG